MAAQNISYNESDDVYVIKGIYTKMDEANKNFIIGGLSFIIIVLLVVLILLVVEKKDNVKNLKSIILSE